MAKRRKASAGGRSNHHQAPSDRLVGLAQEALKIAKSARRNSRSLSGMNFYADKMANLRADATNAFRELGEPTLGEASALAELMETVFSAKAEPKARTHAARDLQHALRTTIVAPPASGASREDGGLFPLVKLTQTGRGYFITVGRQMNGAYAEGWYDACAVMMRRLLETVIIEAFEKKGIDSKIKNSKGEFFMLTGLVTAVLNETSWNLPRTVRRNLPDLKDAGHRSAHNRYYLADKSDIDKLQPALRESVEAFLHIAGLL